MSSLTTDLKRECPTCGEPWERVLSWYENRRYDMDDKARETPLALGWKPSCSCSGLVIIGAQPSIPPDPVGGEGVAYLSDFTLWQARLRSWYQLWASLEPLYEEEPVSISELRADWWPGWVAAERPSP